MTTARHEPQHTYEAPEALRLGGAEEATGDCTDPGSNDYTCQPAGTGGCLHCETGNDASSECAGDGSAATAYGCLSSGIQAQGIQCQGEGSGFS
jgi:hypothetical protein